MKVIVDKKNKKPFSFHMKNFLRNAIIIFSYTLGFSLYAFIFMAWSIDYKHFIFNINQLAWLSVPILGFLMGITHMFFIYKGSLFCRALTMFTIMFYVFLFPIVVAVIN